MTYIVVENCIKCKYMDCVEVCPVDCFYEGENMLVIHPDECIDCAGGGNAVRICQQTMQGCYCGCSAEEETKEGGEKLTSWLTLA